MNVESYAKLEEAEKALCGAFKYPLPAWEANKLQDCLNAIAGILREWSFQKHLMQNDSVAGEQE